MYQEERENVRNYWMLNILAIIIIIILIFLIFRTIERKRARVTCENKPIVVQSVY